jgi:hypothetical protein
MPVGHHAWRMDNRHPSANLRRIEPHPGVEARRRDDNVTLTVGRAKPYRRRHDRHWLEAARRIVGLRRISASGGDKSPCQGKGENGFPVFHARLTSAARI